jgi:hypothetical protein
MPKIKTIYIRHYQLHVGTYYGTFGDKQVHEIFPYKGYYYILSDDVVVAKFKESEILGVAYENQR